MLIGYRVFFEIMIFFFLVFITNCLLKEEAGFSPCSWIPVTLPHTSQGVCLLMSEVTQPVLN